jgi:uncharacterized membrane-anchored protein YitT (DUF2179 family)
MRMKLVIGGRKMKLFKSKKDLEMIVNRVYKANLPQRYCLFFLGIYLYALSFNLFFSPYNIVTGGTTGLALIARELLGINTGLFVFFISLVILIISYFTLGLKMTTNAVVGLIVLPIFIQATEIFTYFINFENTSMLALMIYGGALLGFANGLIMRTGFSLGGVQSICQIMNKYLKISIGKANLIVNLIIILMGSYVFGINNALYAGVALYVSSFVMDKVILGISDSKAFYIVTSKEKEVKEFIINELGHSVTLLDAKGGYSDKKLKVLLCVIPTREYILFKDVISEIDSSAFYIITDSYEVKGGI